MNRITNAFSAAIPSSTSSDASSIHHTRDSPSIPSPLEPAFPPALTLRTNSHDRRAVAHNIVYDDPRTVYFNPLPASSAGGESRFASAFSNISSNHLSAGGSGLQRFGRPNMLRHLTDDGSGRGSGMSTPRARSESTERDKGVRVNLMAAATAAKRGWGMSSATGTTRINRMAEGPDGKYAVGGGQYLRLFEIYDPSSGSSTPMIGQTDDASRDSRTLLATGQGGSTISEVANLWSSKWPVGRGVNDMDWGVGAYDRKLVTATPSGIVMVFDLEKQKYERDIRDGNSRPVNCVRFCPVASYGHMIMSGGTDGVIRCFDLRAPNSGNKRQVKQSGAVTSLAFAPNDPAAFVSGWDDGSIKRFDWKVPGKSVGKAFGAHGSKAVMDLQWKVEDGEWMASAGADRTVQVWDMNQSWDRTPTPIHTLHTAHPIRRVAWRPNHPTELLVVPLTQPQSSSNSIDASVPSSTPKLSSSTDLSAAGGDDAAHLEVWHVRRHYVAKYAVPSQDGVATDVSWKSDGELVVAFQNGGFAQLDVKNSLGSGKVPLPLDGIPRQVVAWSSRGELVYALDRFKSGEIPFDDLKPEYANHWEKVGRQPGQISDPPYYPLQTIGFLPLPDTSEDTFAFLANQYRVEGLAPASLCAWNRDVANWCGREDDARLWGFAKVLIEEFAPELAGEGTFRQDVFAHQKEEGKESHTPREVSPTGSPGAAPAARLPNGSDSPTARRILTSSPLALSIPLRRLSLSDESQSEDEDSSSGNSSSGSSSYTDDDSHAAAAHPRSKFVSFAEPDAPHPRDRRGSVSSIGSPLADKREPSMSSGWDKETGGSGSTGAGGATGGKKSSLTKMTMTNSRQQLASASDWPDPYGIVPEPTPAGGTSRASTRSSPIPTMGRSARGSPRGSGLGLGLAAGVRGSDGEVGLGLGNGVAGHGSLGLGGAVGGAGRGEEMRGKEERFEKREWEEYRKRRIRGLMSWWEGCIDGGEMQLATTLAIVASSLTPFPPAQTERLAHSYVEALERHRLPLPAAYIRRHAAIPSLEITAQDQGMTHTFHCQRCGKSTGSLEDIGVEGKVFWWCKRCGLDSKSCAVCRRGVRGLWMGCRRCNHGGHQKCMRLYHATAPLIPYNFSDPHSHPQPHGGQLRPRSPSQGTNAANSAINASSVYASAISGYTLSTTEASGGTEYTGGGDAGEGAFKGGWGVCPTGCGCRCRRVGGEAGTEA
ncbi:hypothetical protein IAT38_006666 [Cryptococcus sp. DSM 104549]